MDDLGQRIRSLADGVRLAGRILVPRASAAELEALIADAARLMGAESSSYLVLDEKTGELCFAAATGPAADKVRSLRLKPGEGLAAAVMATGQAIATLDASHDPRWKRDAGTGYVARAALVVPVVASSTLEGEMVFGVIEFLNKPGGFTADDMAFAGNLARVVGHGYQALRFLNDGGRMLVALLEQLFSDAAIPQDKELLLALNQQACGVGADDEAFALADAIATAAAREPAVIPFARQVLEGALALGKSGGSGGRRLTAAGPAAAGGPFDNTVE